MGDYSMETALKAQNWELAKGRLRAQVKLAEAVGVSEYRGYPQDEKWLDLMTAVDTFINEVEENGWAL